MSEKKKISNQTFKRNAKTESNQQHVQKTPEKANILVSETSEISKATPPKRISLPVAISPKSPFSYQTSGKLLFFIA